MLNCIFFHSKTTVENTKRNRCSPINPHLQIKQSGIDPNTVFVQTSSFFLFFKFFETMSHYVVQADLVVTLYSKLPLSTLRLFCFSWWNAGIIDLCHHAVISQTLIYRLTNIFLQLYWWIHAKREDAVYFVLYSSQMNLLEIENKIVAAIVNKTELGILTSWKSAFMKCSYKEKL